MAKSKKFLNPEDLLGQLISSDFDLSRFDQIDETHIAKPPNFVEWSLGRDFCNATLLPWQVEAGMHLFSDFCPECSNPEYTSELFDETMGEIFDNLTFLQHGVCPKCKKNRLELFTLGEKHPSKPSLKTEFVGNLGQRSGKCLGASTEVQTPQGPVAIQDIQVGDTVYGWNRDGSISEIRVTRKWDNGIQLVRDLTWQGRFLAACTDEHTWLTERDRKIQERKLKEFKDDKEVTICCIPSPDSIRPEFGELYPCQTYDIEVGNETNLYVLAHEGLITHNSKFVAGASSYQTVRWLGMHDPLGFYGLPRMEVVLGTFSALSAEQAEENLWMPYKGLIDNSPWFKKYHEFLKGEEKRLSIPLCDVKDTYLFYPHKRLMLSFTGSDDRKKRGRTRLLGAIDEIAFLNSDPGSSKKKVMDADKNYAALNNSLSTIRQKALLRLAEGHYDTPMPIMYNASSPYNVQDKIMRLTKAAPDNPFSIVIHRSTWGSNPDYTEKTCRAINPGLSLVEFERDFGAIPPFSDSPFIGDARVLEKLCVNPELFKPIIQATREIHTDLLGDRYLYLKAQVLRIDKGTPRLLALDNGYNHNAFGAALFGYDAAHKKPVLQFLVSLYPEPQANLSIHFPSMFEHFILPIVKGLNIKNIVYDRWQSLDQIQRLRDMKIDAQAHSLSFEKDMLPFKQQLLSGNMILPPLEVAIQKVKDAPNPLVETAQRPVANLIWQALTVRQVGRQVLKPLVGDDDLFRAFLLGGSRFLSEDIQKTYATFSGVRSALQGGAFVGSFHSTHGGANQAPPARAGGSFRIAKYRSLSGK